MEKANTVYPQITEDTTETKTYIFHIDNSEGYDNLIDAIEKYEKYYENIYNRLKGLYSYVKYK